MFWKIVLTLFMSAFVVACSGTVFPPKTMNPVVPSASGEEPRTQAPDITLPDAGEPSSCPMGWICPQTPLFNSKIGMWYSLAYEASPGIPKCPMAWSESRYVPLAGFYDSSDPKVVDQHFALLKDAGVDFLILDFTNGIAPDPTRSHIYKSGETVLKRNSDPTAPTQMPFALAIGAQMWAYRSMEGQKNEANFVLDHYAKPGGVKNPNYFHMDDGRPLLVNYNAHDFPDAFEPNWNDPRFYVGRANPMISVASPRLPLYGTSWWGWVSEHPNFLADDAVTVSPGADNTHRCDCIGNIHYDRNGGSHANCADCDLSCTFTPTACPAFPTQCSAAITGGPPPVRGTSPGLTFILEWLRAIKKNPKVIVVASWNEFGDETAIEPAVARVDGNGPSGVGPSWVDYYGVEAPDWYLQIASGYADLRTGMRPGVVYQDEDSTQNFTIVNGKWVAHAEKPHGRPIILLPAGTLRQLGAQLPEVPPLPPEGTVISALGYPYAVVTRGGAVRFEVSATALKFGSPIMLEPEVYQAIPYAGTIRANAPVYVAPQLPPAFESDLGELWQFDCLDVLGTNGSFVNSNQVAVKYNTFTVRSGLHCK